MSFVSVHVHVCSKYISIYLFWFSNRRVESERHSKEEKQTREGGKRLGQLTAEISNLEHAFEVRYRPERPEFSKILFEAEQLAQKMFEHMDDENWKTAYSGNRSIWTCNPNGPGWPPFSTIRSTRSCVAPL